MSFQQFLSQRSALLKHHPDSRIAFALFTEFLTITLFAFSALLSLEMLLPTFVSAHINLAFCFGSILVLFFFHTILRAWLSIKIHALSRSLLRLIIPFLGLWGAGVITLSLLKFPLLAIITILLLVFLTGYLFFQKT